MAAKERSIVAGKKGPVWWLRSGRCQAQKVGLRVGSYFSEVLSPERFILGAR